MTSDILNPTWKGQIGWVIFQKSISEHSTRPFSIATKNQWCGHWFRGLGPGQIGKSISSASALSVTSMRSFTRTSTLRSLGWFPVCSAAGLHVCTLNLPLFKQSIKACWETSCCLDSRMLNSRCTAVWLDFTQLIITFNGTVFTSLLPTQLLISFLETQQRRSNKTWLVHWRRDHMYVYCLFFHFHYMKPLPWVEDDALLMAKYG